MRICLYGGTYDPIHNAHLTIAECAVEQLFLDELVFMPSAISPHKTRQTVAKSDARLLMVQTAIKSYPAFSASDYEMKKQGISFTVETVEHLAILYNVSRDDFFMLIGEDNYKDFEKWREPEKILELCTPVVAARPGFSKYSIQSKEFLFLDSPLMDISSTKIRNRVKKNQPIDELVPNSVAEIIYKYKLYL